VFYIGTFSVNSLNMCSGRAVEELEVAVLLCLIVVY